jgi:hypothetical protein
VEEGEPIVLVVRVRRKTEKADSSRGESEAKGGENR